jgi:membrane-bound serine protease (ClpP class)
MRTWTVPCEGSRGIVSGQEFLAKFVSMSFTKSRVCAGRKRQRLLAKSIDDLHGCNICMKPGRLRSYRVLCTLSESWLYLDAPGSLCYSEHKRGGLYVLKKGLVTCIVVNLIVFAMLCLAGAQQVGSTMYVIPLQGTIAPGLAEYVGRAMHEAVNGRADAIFFEITTFGGEVSAAIEIRDLIINSEIPVIVYVKNRALSAGALITIAADKIIMAPGSTVGAAETRPNEEKYISAFRAEFESTAERTGRNKTIAGAMVDADIEIEGLVAKGKILTLTAGTALNLGFIDGVASTREDALVVAGYRPARIVEVNMNWAERLAQILTDPTISSLLLTIGFAGIIIEILTPGFGVPGVLGILAMVLFFGGRMVVGLAGWGLVLLFIVGILLLAAEVFVFPGFGISGILGMIATFSSIGFAYADKQQAAISLLISLILAIGLIVLALKYLPKTRTWGKIVLTTKLDTESGYVTQPAFIDYLDKEGVAITPLRPAGIVEVDGNRLDVATEGVFLSAGTAVRIVKVEGNKIIVRRVE